MSPDRPSLAYAASLPLDSPGGRCRIEKTLEGLFITIPPPKLWVLLAGPTVGLVLAVAPLTIIGYLLIAQILNAGRSDIIPCSIVGSIIFMILAGYNLTRLLRAARFGRKSIFISIMRDALTVERGTEGAEPESLSMKPGIAFHVRESAPTMTFGKLVELHFLSVGQNIPVHFYTRQWTLARELRFAIVQQLREFSAERMR